MVEINKLNMLEHVFSRRFKEAVKRKGISLAELQRELGIANATVYRWSTGETLPTGLYLYQIAVECNVSVDWLLGLKEGYEI